MMCLSQVALDQALTPSIFQLQRRSGGRRSCPAAGLPGLYVPELHEQHPDIDRREPNSHRPWHHRTRAAYTTVRIAVFRYFVVFIGNFLRDAEPDQPAASRWNDHSLQILHDNSDDVAVLRIFTGARRLRSAKRNRVPSRPSRNRVRLRSSERRWCLCGGRETTQNVRGGKCASHVSLYS